VPIKHDTYDRDLRNLMPVGEKSFLARNPFSPRLPAWLKTANTQSVCPAESKDLSRCSVGLAPAMV